MAQTKRQRRRGDLDRIKRLFGPDATEYERLTLLARLEMETRLYAGQ